MTCSDNEQCSNQNGKNTKHEHAEQTQTSKKIRNRCHGVVIILCRNRKNGEIRRQLCD